MTALKYQGRIPFFPRYSHLRVHTAIDTVFPVLSHLKLVYLVADLNQMTGIKKLWGNCFLHRVGGLGTRRISQIDDRRKDKQRN